MATATLSTPDAAPAAEPFAAMPRLRGSRVALGLIWATWSLCGSLALGFLAQPVGTSAQLALCASAGAGMLVLWLFFPRRGLPRMAFLTLGTSVVIRYVYWRLTGTLPNLDDPVSFSLGLVLALAELYCVLILTVSLIINAEPLARSAAPALPDADSPTVDIFIPTYNESTEILSLTLAAAKNLDYPETRFTVWLLDDGGTDQKCADADPAKAGAAAARRAELQALCARLGARYLTRARNQHAKAGKPQQRPAGVERRARPGARCRPCPLPPLPARDGGPVLDRSQALPRADAARVPEPGPRWSGTCAPSRRCRPRTRCSTASPRPASTSGTARSSAVPPRCCAAPRSTRSAASPASPSPRIARPRSNCIRAAGRAPTSTRR